DLVLYGHLHDRIEYRVRWNAEASHLEYYTDFYTENPDEYYHTVSRVPTLPKGAVIEVRVREGAPTNGTIQKVTLDPDAASTAAPATYGVIDTPPFAAPLDKSTDPRSWWAEHRPILAQTASLGCCDPRQRFGTFLQMKPSIDGFRPIMEF